MTATTLLCALLLAATCTTPRPVLPVPSPDDDPASISLLQSENEGASSRPLNYGPLGVLR